LPFSNFPFLYKEGIGEVKAPISSLKKFVETTKVFPEEIAR
jgi:hypothetical protein